MASKAMTPASDSPNPSAPLFALHDTVTGEWFVFDDQTSWLEDQLYLDPPDDEFAFACPGCLRPLSKCSCPMTDE